MVQSTVHLSRKYVDVYPAAEPVTLTFRVPRRGKPNDCTIHAKPKTMGVVNRKYRRNKKDTGLVTGVCLPIAA